MAYSFVLDYRYLSTFYFLIIIPKLVLDISFSNQISLHQMFFFTQDKKSSEKSFFNSSVAVYFHTLEIYIYGTHIVSVFINFSPLDNMLLTSQQCSPTYKHPHMDEKPFL